MVRPDFWHLVCGFLLRARQHIFPTKADAKKKFPLLSHLIQRMFSVWVITLPTWRTAPNSVFLCTPPHPQLPNPSWFPSNEWKRQTHQAILESQLFPQRENHITHWATFPKKPSLSGPHLQTPIILIILKHSETRKEPCSREHYSNWHCHSDVPGGLLAVSCPKSVLCYTHSSHTPLSVLDI